MFHHSRHRSCTTWCMLLQLLLLCLFSATALAGNSHDKRQSSSGDVYLVGAGKADITGPVVEIAFMGYASLDQKGTGLRQRIYSRAFIVGNVDNPDERICYIIVDTAMGDTAVRAGVLDQLKTKYNGLYNRENVAFVGTHSHSGPGAWSNYLLPQITTLGLDSQSYTAVVEGVVRSVQRAHDSLKRGTLGLSKKVITGANVNRSPWAYEANPAEERKRYESVGGEVDKEMTVLTFKGEDGKPFALLNWFPVHGTSLYNNNTLVTGDNKGLAALMLEKDIGGGFIAGFSQANVGDTSPNTLGAVCQDTGLPCKYEDSTCDGKNQKCMGRGPAFQISDAESNRIIAEKQYLAAKELFQGSQTPVGGDSGIVRSYHTFVDFGAPYTFKLPDGTDARTCKAAMGFSFAAGTTDGPGAFDFTQGDEGKPNNPMWLAVRNLLKTPSAEQVECHKPKPILLNVGEMDKPYAWSPNIVDIQMQRIGQLAIIVSPGEATTMAGRRWKASVVEELNTLGIVKKEAAWAVIGGPANSYTHYITTPEEYARQRYEGASTLYGQQTLNAYISLTKKFAPYLAAKLPSSAIPLGPNPPVNTNNSLAFNTGVVMDNPPLGKKFGNVLKDVNTRYSKGQSASATFVGANPRNNIRLEGTFAAVEKNNGGTWARVRDDSDYDLVYRWKRTEGLTGQSEVTIEWKIEESTQAGQYRIRYYGDAKAAFTGKITAFEGVSRAFEVA